MRICARPIAFIGSMRLRTPSRLLIAPQDIRTADPTVADDIYSGYFAFGSKAVDVHGASPFAVASPSVEWERALMGFGWLRDLRAANNALSKANAAALVDEWISLRGSSRRGQAWTPEVVARRMLSFLSHSPLVLENADARFYRKFMRSIGRHVVYLHREGVAGSGGETRLLTIIALNSAALCTEGLNLPAKRLVRQLQNELKRQILIDGAHAGRNPNTIVELLLDLLPLRQAFVARNQEAPPALIQAIDRMLPMVRLFRHGDGSLALFNGMGVTHQDALAAVMAHDDTRAKPIMNGIASGFQRIESGNVVVIADMGKPPPAEFSGGAHAGTLSFEMSSGRSRIIVNCGAPESLQGPPREAARLTAAHSTLSIRDTSSSRIAGHDGADRLLDGRILQGPGAVEAERFESSSGITIQASHDGYAGRFGLIHERAIAVDTPGRVVSGRDRLAPAGGKMHADAAFAIRFHLHPDVRAGSVENGQAALLVTGDGQQWVFRCTGQQIAIEESIFFANTEGPRATSQLVIRGECRPDTTVDWSLRQQGED